MDNRNHRLVPNSPAQPWNTFLGDSWQNRTLHQELKHPVELELCETSSVLKDTPGFFLKKQKYLPKSLSGVASFLKPNLRKSLGMTCLRVATSLMGVTESLPSLSNAIRRSSLIFSRASTSPDSIGRFIGSSNTFNINVWSTCN